MPTTDGDIGSILGVWAHPDDEAYLSAGLMMRANDLGHRVVCVTATRGEAGFPEDDARPVEERMAIRERELAACLGILGVGEHRWLDYGDGQCATAPDEEAAEKIAAIISEVRPDNVLCFAPDGATGHPDHIATCRWTTRAVELAGLAETRLLYSTKSNRWSEEVLGSMDLGRVMMIDDLEPESWDESELAVWFTPDDEMTDRKVAALLAQESQIVDFADHLGRDVFRRFVREEFYRTTRPEDADFLERTRHWKARR